MPKQYAIAIVSISGVLVCFAAIASIIEDSFKLQAGTYKQENEVDSHVDNG
ncbi:MAG: hypothetical protein ACI9XK_000667 [Granulosicoccus sp.]|jgi:hypothetical protein